MTISITDIQAALKDRGFDPGPIDGVRGRKTIAAIMAFQTAWGLQADGIVGPLTLAKLMPDAPAADVTLSSSMPWFAEARRLIGLAEDTSAGSNAQILEWARDLGVAYHDDDVPWCGLFVGHCIASQLPREPLPAEPLRARAYQRFGKPVTPQPGAIMVFWRESMASGKGHVGFYAAETPGGDFLILGGNQGDEVSILRKSRDRFLEARWPVTAPPAEGGPLLAAAGRTGDQREA